MPYPSHADVLVAGGGVAGIAAAAAAARQGATTVLIEKSGALGGTPFVVFHHVLCGLYGSHPAVPNRPLNGGLTQTLCDTLTRKDPSLRPQRMGAVYVLPFTPRVLRAALLALLPPMPSLTLQLNTEVLSADFNQASGVQVTVRFAASAETHVITAKAVIDCTGDGRMLQSSGAALPATPVSELPYAGFSVRFANLVAQDRAMLAIKVPYALRQAVEANAAPPWLQFTTYQPGSSHTEGVCKLSIPPALPPDREVDTVRESTEAVDRILRAACPEFRHATVTETSPYAVQREGARLAGRTILTADDVLEARGFPNPAARHAWPIEQWLQNSRPRLRYCPPGRAGTIPITCLQSARFPRLWAAGRCLSATSDALASCRVIGVCLPLGEAAGRAAARQTCRK